MTRWGNDFERASRRYAIATAVVQIIAAVLLVLAALLALGVVNP